MSKFGTKNALIGYFWAGIWKQNCHILKQHPRICVIPKFLEIIKMPKFGTKNDLFRYFWPKMSYLGIFGLELEKKYLKPASLKLGAKILKFETKNAWFYYFGTGILKSYCHIWNQYPWICLIAKFWKKQNKTKQRKHKFGTKNTLFGYFWARTLKNYCHISNQHPWICQIWIFNPSSELSYRIRYL